jgi:GNAT superfamily N-acetyltransferase
MGATVEVRRVSVALRDDFHCVHDEAAGCGWCACVFWWVPTNDGWGERTAEENRALRDQLFARGEEDGYLLYEDGVPVAWCQAGPRDRWPKLAAAMQAEPDPEAWAIPCVLVHPSARGRGYARLLLRGALDDLRARGVRRVEAFPRPGGDLPADEAWTGPEAIFVEGGFRRLRDTGRRTVYALEFDADAGSEG